MAKEFTEEQIKAFLENPYVLKCTERSVTFTEEFKEIFIEEYEETPLPTLIFRKYGIDTNALGEKRISSFSNRIRKQNQRDEGFGDLRAHNTGRPTTKDKTLEELVEYYKNKAEILQQENDFLKRVRSINRRQISKQSKIRQPKTNSN